MRTATARAIVGMQTRSIKKADGIKFVHKRHEYRITYFGGFGAYVGLDRREIGRRKFSYYDGFSAVHLWTAQDVVDTAMKLVEEKEVGR